MSFSFSQPIPFSFGSFNNPGFFHLTRDKTDKDLDKRIEEFNIRQNKANKEENKKDDQTDKEENSFHEEDFKINIKRILMKEKANKKLKQLPSIELQSKGALFRVREIRSKSSFDSNIRKDISMPNLKLRPIKSALKNSPSCKKIKKERSVVFKNINNVVEVESWKKYNTDVSRDNIRKKKESLCWLF